MKQKMCAAVGMLGGIVATAFGGWNGAIVSLLICMGVDYATGLIVAGVFHKSPNSSGGGLESAAGWKGLARKFVTLLIVIVAHRMDQLLALDYIREAVIIGFCANECISIVENAGLMGIPVPQVIRKAIDALQDKE